MTRHELYPDWIVLKYTSFGRQKRAILPCHIDGSAVAGLEPDLTVRVGASIAATACVSAYCTAAAHLFHSDASFDAYEIYHKATLTSPPTLIYAAALALVGTGTPSNVEYSEIVYSFKTPTQGGLKLYVMEGNVVPDLKLPMPLASGSEGEFLQDFILGDSNFVIGRNGEMPLIGLYLTTKQNDYYRRRYKL